LHVDAPTSHVDWSAGAVSLLTEATAWPEVDRARRAGVSSFGLSGTNAHLILEEAPAEPAVPTAASGVLPWVLSARTSQALSDAAGRLAEVEPSGDTAYSLATTRATFEHRAVVIAESGSLTDGLAALAAGTSASHVVRGTAAPGATAVLFTGQGSQRLGMGRELLATQPVFAAAFDEVCAELDQPIRDVVFGEEAALLDRTDFAQPALFTIEVALYRLLEHFGVRADYLVGHSVGEIAAAHVAGVLSLVDAAKLVSARGRLMQAARSGGAMIAVQASEEEILPFLAGQEHLAGIASINGPKSVVLSGDDEAVTALAAHWRAQGRKTSRLRVSHAFHSPHMDSVLDDFRQVAESLTYHEPRIPIVSTVTGEMDEMRTPEYWVEQIRRPVRFLDAVRTLETQGVTACLEAGPDGVLTAAAEDCFAETPALAAVLRRDRPEPETLLTALATAYVRGTDVDWAAAFPGGGRRVDLPTYPFQHRRFWIDAPATSGDHSLLGAAVELADGGSTVFTGRLSRSAQPWLADHAVLGTTLVPGSALLELVLHAGRQSGYDQVAELDLHEPLVLPSRGGMRIQVTLSASRKVSVHAQPDDGETPWTLHASGVLTAAEATEPAEPWSPVGTAVDVGEAYDRLADSGYEYGPAFQCLRAAWHDGDDVYAEVALPEEQSADRFALHPALLDAALHPVVLQTLGGDMLLPFAWRGVTVHRTGERELRVRITRTPDGYTLRVTNLDGAAVMTVDELAVRPVPAGGFAARQVLYEIGWSPVTTTTTTDWAFLDEFAGERTVVLAPGPADGDVPAQAHAVAQSTLRQLQYWLTEERFADTQLVVVTRRAVDVDDDIDLAMAPVWGLVRSAQAEHPGRIALLDVEGDIPAELPVGEPQLALRDSVTRAPRLAPTESTVDKPGFDPEGTVLVTGGTGALGRLVARHLVETHGVRNLLLVSRSGGTVELDANVTVAACDVADRDELARLLGTIPAEHPLTAVVHAAGVVEDATVAALTPDRLDAVFRPKVDAAWHLHELTSVPIILFSSAAGVLGTAGQAGYAAANTFLDALAVTRPGTSSIAWGVWEAGMASALGGVDLARIQRSGLTALTDGQGLALFDAALGHPNAVAVRFDRAALRAQAESLPPVLRSLVPTRPAKSGPALVERLDGRSETEQEKILLDLVRTHAAAVLGHPDPGTIRPDHAFAELGFDSLTAVELRNRLTTETRVKLSATLVFDHPTPAVLARRIRSELTAGAPSGARL
ncbi:MAG TPA: type I polyketide synthase, partial [Amycolatopsis sp.]|nr:type I polyketide synthase [Amycolatopsis sp.]